MQYFTVQSAVLRLPVGLPTDFPSISAAGAVLAKVPGVRAILGEENR
jgi:hypothetical protein